MHPRSCRPAALALLTFTTLAACASGGETGQLGNYAAHTPTLEVEENLARPTTVDVSLASPAHAVVLFVIPGRGATVIYPTDSTTNNQLSAGRHTLITSFSDRSKLIDTSFLPRPSQRDSSRRQNTSPVARVNPTAVEREGYLLLITSTEPLRHTQIVRRVEGVTIPIEDESALNAVSKLVIGTGEHAPWSGFYRLVLVR